MKKIFKISSIVVLAVATVCLQACKDNELSTDQYEGFSLAAFGPNPVMRGATLSFYGSHLENVTEVILPENVSVTDIEVVKSGVPSEIRIQLPDDGIVEGVVKLMAKDGSILSTKSELSYNEPIVFDSFSPESAMPGDVITINGDYMNLVTSVIFADGVTVAVNEGATRSELTVTVPANAVSGLLILSDGQSVPNLIYSEAELEIGDPTVSGLTIATPKPGYDAVIAGEYLQMIQSVVFEGGTTVSNADFTLADDYSTITVSIPSTAQSGDIICKSYAGKEFTAGAYAATVPTGLASAPAPVKAGAELTISGEDLDLVTSLSLPDAANQSFTYSEGSITVTVPASATEGDITLTMDNGDQVTVPYTLVHPTITAVSPTTIVAGETLTVTGTDLDLITSATLGGRDVTITDQSETQIVLTTENTSISGTVSVKLANGETIDDATAITVTYDSFIVVNEMPAAEHIGAIVTLKGSNFMMVENIYIGDAKVTRYVSRSDDEVSFFMPYNTIGIYSIHFDLFSGDRETCPQTIEVLLEQNIVNAWEGSLQLTWGDGGRVLIPASKFNDIPAGTTMRIYYTQRDQTWDQAQFNYGDWSGINFDDPAGTTFSQTLVPTDVYGWFTDGILDRCTEVILTQTILDNIQAKKGACEDQTGVGMIIQGQGLTFTQIELVADIPQTIYMWNGDIGPTDWGGATMLPYASLEHADLLVPGCTLGFDFYCGDEAEYWQIEFLGSWWTSLPSMMVGGERKQWSFEKGNTNIEFVITQEDIDIIVAQGFYFAGNGVHMTGVYVK